MPSDETRATTVAAADPVDATLLPAGRARPAAPEGVSAPDARSTRRLRRDVVLGCALALAAVGATLAAVGGLGGDPPPSRTGATAQPAEPPGSQVTVTRRGANGLHVTERLSLPRSASSVALTRPNLASDPSLTLPQPTVSELTATAVGSGARVRPTPTGWAVDADGSGRLTVVTIDYNLSGAIVSESGTPVLGRALLVVAPVSADVARSLQLPVVVTAPGIDVRQAICVSSPATQQLCGETGEAGVSARLTTWQRVAVVVLQADLDT